MYSDEETEKISPARLADLLRAERILDALYAHGVDNWEWYDDAMDDLEENS